MADEQIYDQHQPRSHSQHSESAVHGKSLHGEFVWDQFCFVSPITGLVQLRGLQPSTLTEPLESISH